MRPGAFRPRQTGNHGREDSAASMRPAVMNSSVSIPASAEVAPVQSAIDVALAPVTDRAAVGRLWQDLEPRADCSYFQSWAWIGTWLDVLPDGVRPHLLVARAGGEVVGLGILCHHVVTRHGWLRSRAAFLHETGNPDLDCLTVEHNGFLVDRTRGPEIERAMLQTLVTGGDWEELMLSGVDPRYADVARDARLDVFERAVQPSPYVDLDAVRAGGKGYLGQVSSNTRQQIRRALKLYGETGPLRAVEPADLAEALRFFGALKTLHQQVWTGRGRSGAFAMPFFERFHEALIRARFAHGEIQLLRIEAGDTPLGYLYSMVRDGHVYFYQSGLSYSDDPKLKPGHVCHHLAIERNLAGGARVYDFLAGDSQYKRSLGTHSKPLVWLSARRPRLKFRLENMLRQAKRKLARAGAAGDRAST